MADNDSINTQPTSHIGSDMSFDTGLDDLSDLQLRSPIPSKRRTLQLYMPQQPDPIMLIDLEHVILGRVERENFLDLSLYYARMLGVSRQHAALSYEDGNYYITDLGSTNGTYLNNIKIDADVPHQLSTSDQLRFGHFVAIVSFR